MVDQQPIKQTDLSSSPHMMVTCPVFNCGDIFQTRDELIQHIETIHSLFVCRYPSCQWIFTTRQTSSLCTAAGFRKQQIEKINAQRNRILSNLKNIELLKRNSEEQLREITNEYNDVLRDLKDTYAKLSKDPPIHCNKSYQTTLNKAMKN